MTKDKAVGVNGFFISVDGPLPHSYKPNYNYHCETGKADGHTKADTDGRKNGRANEIMNVGRDPSHRWR